MTQDPKAEADARLDAALARAEVRDPRPLFRPVLKHLRERDPDAFGRALGHYETVLVPAVAAGADPMGAWLQYGLQLAAAMGPGRTVAVDATGRAVTLEQAGVAAAAGGALVLHLPDDDTAPVLVLRYPGSSSAAQDATVELLVAGRVSARVYERGE